MLSNTRMTTIDRVAVSVVAAGLELRHLRSFVAVADELHFGRAAARLPLAQPALSRQVQHVERVVGVPLLHRTSREVRLTPAGRAFLDEARAALGQAERAAEAARRVARGEVGRLAVSFIDAAVYGALPQAVAQFCDAYPGVELSLIERRIPEQLALVAERRVDVGIVHPPVRDDALATEVIAREPLVVALPAAHPLAARPAVVLGDLAGERVVQFPRAINPELYDDTIALCRHAGFSPRLVQEASPKQTIVALVSAGLGVALLPASLQALRRAGVVYRPVDGPNLVVETAAVWRRGDPNPIVHAFLAALRAVRPSAAQAPGTPRPEAGSVASVR
jgi:DNA-binding transcriptional LysR family regulator